MKRALVWLLPIALALVGSSGGAMTVEPAPLTVLMREADAVVRCFVVATATEEVPRRGRTTGAPTLHTTLWTRVTVALVEVSSGPPELAWADTLTLRLPGGETERLRTVVPGVPELRPGDELVLLLMHRNNAWTPIGYGLGVLFVDASQALWRATHGGRPTQRLAPDDALAVPRDLLRAP